MSRKQIELGQEPIWEIQFDETVTQYRAFCLYRDLLDGRSLAKVNAIWSKDPTVDPEKGKAKGGAMAKLQQWSATNRWVERADAYLLHLLRRFRDERETEIARMARTEASLGRTMVGMAVTRLLGGERDGVSVTALNPNDLTAAETALLAREGVKISRLSTGRPTELIKGALLISSTEFVQATGDLTEILMRHIPDDRKAIAAEEIRAYAAGERRMIGQ